MSLSSQALLKNALKAHRKGDVAAAERLYAKLLRQAPGEPNALHLLGVIRAQQSRFSEADRLIAASLASNPSAEALNNHGGVLVELGRYAEATERLNRALLMRPDYAEAHFNLANALRRSGQAYEAAKSFNAALTFKPDYPEALQNLSDTLRDLNRQPEAIAALRRAIEISPRNPHLHNNLGILLRDSGDLAGAAASYGRAIELKPDFAQALAQYVFMRQKMCDWRGPAPSPEAFAKAARSDAAGTLAFAFLAVADDPAMQLTMARHDSRRPAGQETPALWRGERYEHEKIRLAYLSADYHEHATAYLMAELFERHDRSQFELYAISFGGNEPSAMYRRLTRAFDHFIDVGQLSHHDAARKIREAEIDIAVDLKGFTGRSRPWILGHRPAPIQVNYLGYPGTMGADFIDYIIVDPFVVPAGQQVNFTEKLVHLPECYQVNDRHREIADRTPSRAECELPETGFVFCCFNNSYKLTPLFFDIWMRLLAAVPGSVLWLLADNAWSRENLRREAAARGVDPDRLVFAPRMKLPEHLARHRLADLCLDTLPYNAHTTASDALWAGLPVLTCPGHSFAARVAGSLLQAVGMPELIARDLEAYEDLALSLATRPDTLRGLKEKLGRNRGTTPLFDSERFRRHIEAAYAKMWSIWRQGREPTAFAIAPIENAG